MGSFGSFAAAVMQWQPQEIEGAGVSITFSNRDRYDVAVGSVDFAGLSKMICFIDPPSVRIIYSHGLDQDRLHASQRI